MKKNLLASLLLTIAAFHSFSQKKKDINPLIDAEKAFAAYSVSHSTKEAFLQFLDSNGIIFDKGKPVNGIETWLKREKSPGVLNWQPSWAEISASGDFGFTSGPWTFQPAGTTDSVVARGNYTTVWHRNKNGEWKFLVDLGVGNSPAPNDVPHWWQQHAVEPATYTGSQQSLLKAEEQFIAKTKTATGRLEYYQQSVYPAPYTAVLHRNRRIPAMGRDQLMDIINTMPAQIDYTVEGSGIASSGDLGYVYGATNINGKADNYMRIWKKDREGWKIVVEVLRY